MSLQEGVAPEKTVPELLGDLASETGVLVKHEVALATRELGEKAKVAATQVVYMAVALLVATAALLSLVAALIIGLSAYVPAWISATVVGVGLAVAAWLLYQKTLAALSSITPVPERAVQTIKDTKSWVQEQTR